MSVATTQLSFFCNNVTLMLGLPVFPTIPVVQFASEGVRRKGRWWRTGRTRKHRQQVLRSTMSQSEPDSFLQKGPFSFVPHFEWDIKCVWVRMNVCLSATKSIIGTKQAEKSINSQRPLNCLRDTPTQSSLSLERQLLEQLCCKNCPPGPSNQAHKLITEKSQCVAQKMARTATFPRKRKKFKIKNKWQIELN